MGGRCSTIWRSAKKAPGSQRRKRVSPRELQMRPPGHALRQRVNLLEQLRQNQPLRREPSQLRNLRHPHQLNRYLKFFMWRLLRLRRKATPRKPQILSQASRQNKFQARRHTMRTQRHRMIFMRTHLERKWLNPPQEGCRGCCWMEQRPGSRGHQGYRTGTEARRQPAIHQLGREGVRTSARAREESMSVAGREPE